LNRSEYVSSVIRTAAFANKVSVTHIHFLAGAADFTNFANGVDLLSFTSVNDTEKSVEAGNSRRLSEDGADAGEERKQDLFGVHV
jgi:hypothetical protein